MKPLVVLSLCDGLAVGYSVIRELMDDFQSLEYNAVEINEAVRKLTDANFPGKIRRPCHDVKFMASNLEKFKDLLSRVDMIVFGFPCTSLSSQGKMNDWEGESGLFWACMEILNYIKKFNPNLKFFIENVASMRNSIREEISATIGVPHFELDASYFGPQARVRYYWFNWAAPLVPEVHSSIMPVDCLEDDGITLVSVSKSNRGKDDFGDPIVEGRARKDGKAGTLVTGDGCNGQSTRNLVITNKLKTRDLRVPEAAKIQGLGEWNFSSVSNAVAFEAIGNSWDRRAVKEILKGAFEDAA